jgi:AmmeMemoRadiSam system protein B
LQQTCVKAGLPTDAWKDDATQIHVFEGSEIRGRLRPQVAEDRQPAVAGAFYPGSASAVKYAVEQLFAPAKNVAQESWAGAMVPHAGWMYSGRLAAATLARITVPQTAIILCPKHRVHGARWAVAPHQRWLFPGGELASDPELAGRLASAVDGLELDEAAHRDEHAIEVQLPLLAHVAPHVRVVGITVGDSTLPDLLQFGMAMSAVLRDMPERPLLIVSSDMNHFADEAETRRLDRLALDAIQLLDPASVYDVVRKNRISMCGAAPCVVVMETLRRLDSLNRCEAVGHTTSAEVSGDTSRVVGYAGLLFGA